MTNALFWSGVVCVAILVGVVTLCILVGVLSRKKKPPQSVPIGVMQEPKRRYIEFTGKDGYTVTVIIDKITSLGMHTSRSGTWIGLVGGEDIYMEVPYEQVMALLRGQEDDGESNLQTLP